MFLSRRLCLCLCLSLREEFLHNEAVDIEQEPQNTEYKKDAGKPDKEGAHNPRHVVPCDLHGRLVAASLRDADGVPLGTTKVLNLHLVFPVPIFFILVFF